MVKRVADEIPAYEVQNDVNKKRQVLHRAWLLLWLAEPEGEPLRINRISIESGLTGGELATPLCRSVKLSVVPPKLIYGLNTAILSPSESCQDWWWAMKPEGCLWGRPEMEQAIGSPVTSSLVGGLCVPCWETSLQDERNRPDDVLKHDSSRGQEMGRAGR